jgi:hypothetical protein
MGKHATTMKSQRPLTHKTRYIGIINSSFPIHKSHQTKIPSRFPKADHLSIRRSQMGRTSAVVKTSSLSARNIAATHRLIKLEDRRRNRSVDIWRDERLLVYGSRTILRACLSLPSLPIAISAAVAETCAKCYLSLRMSKHAVRSNFSP